ncbi:MAG: hypothetical protein ACRBBM_00555 [Pseudomonadaceae bacterium]|jgi:hypothetical protein
MKGLKIAVLLIAAAAAFPTFADSSGYRITGRAGVLSFVAIDSAGINNEDVYRYAVAEACAGKPICQVHYWENNAPTKLPFTTEQVESKLVVWQLNLNTGLRRWLVKCSQSDLFRNERECM